MEKDNVLKITYGGLITISILGLGLISYMFTGIFSPKDREVRKKFTHYGAQMQVVSEEQRYGLKVKKHFITSKKGDRLTRLIISDEGEKIFAKEGEFKIGGIEQK